MCEFSLTSPAGTSSRHLSHSAAAGSSSQSGETEHSADRWQHGRCTQSLSEPPEHCRETGSGVRLESDWSRTGVRPESDYSRTGVRLESDWSRTGVRPESDSSRTGVGLESDWSRTGVRPESDSSRTGVRPELASSRTGVRPELDSGLTGVRLVKPAGGYLSWSLVTWDPCPASGSHPVCTPPCRL